MLQAMYASYFYTLPQRLSILHLSWKVVLVLHRQPLRFFLSMLRMPEDKYTMLTRL